MIKQILESAGFIEDKTYRETRFIQPPQEESYVVYADEVETDGPDGENRIYNHSVTYELYAYYPDQASERAIEDALNAAGVPWSKQSRLWIQTERLYQTIYEYDYIEKV